MGAHREIGLAIGKTDLDWPRACRRGAIIGLVLASHAVLLVAIVIPPTPKRQTESAFRVDANVLRVELLPSSPPLPPPRRWPRTLPVAHPARRVTEPPLRARQREGALQVALAPASASTLANPAPDYIAGGGFAARLRDAQGVPPAPKLPGGHHYLASDLQFQTIAQRSIAGKVHKVAGAIFGWYDPTCKNLEFELTKTRKQMLADGYSMHELEQHAREHHCN